jgi:arabinan endo-1,5-alpha-L-arabinosidase
LFETIFLSSREIVCAIRSDKLARMVHRRLAIVLLTLTIGWGCAPQDFAATSQVHANPVLDADFPDPAVLKAPDGFYYAYATQTERDGRWINLQVARSKTLRDWEYLGDALPARPGWASKTQDFWAPDVQYAAGRYFLYYSAKPDAALSDGKSGLCLAVATSDKPEGPFTDMGKPLQCGDTFVNIDPMAFDDPATGKRLLYWGSGFQPIKVQELAADRMSFAAGSKPTNLVPAIKSDDPNEYQKLVEGAWVVRRGGYYYLFYSGDNCCGPKAHYAVMVARSRSATGPFETAPNKVILQMDAKWIAPGHNSVATDEKGQDWMLYHAVDVDRRRTRPADEVNTRRVMLVDRIEWRDGWPVVRKR